MVWGAMIGLATIADKKPREIYAKLDTVTAAIDTGTLITVVWGTKALAKVAAADKTYKQKIFPTLTAQLKKCIPRDVPMHAESILPAIDEENKQEFISILEACGAAATLCVSKQSEIKKRKVKETIEQGAGGSYVFQLS
jgi:hypothetical protein